MKYILYLLWQLKLLVISYSAAKQQTSWVVSLWWSPLTFVWPGVPKQYTTTAPSSRSERHLMAFCIDEIVPDTWLCWLSCVFVIAAMGVGTSEEYSHTSLGWVYSLVTLLFGFITWWMLKRFCMIEQCVTRCNALGKLSVFIGIGASFKRKNPVNLLKWQAT